MVCGENPGTGCGTCCYRESDQPGMSGNTAVGNILEISGIGENTLSGILAEMGDISRFDDVKEI